MTGVEALWAMKNGAKIRCAGWFPGCHMHIAQSGEQEGAIVFSPDLQTLFMSLDGIEGNDVCNLIKALLDELCNYTWEVTDDI